MELQTRIATCPDYGSYNTILEERTGLDFDFIVGRFVPPQPLQLYPLPHRCWSHLVRCLKSGRDFDLIAVSGLSPPWPLIFNLPLSEIVFSGWVMKIAMTWISGCLHYLPGQWYLIVASQAQHWYSYKAFSDYLQQAHLTHISMILPQFLILCWTNWIKIICLENERSPTAVVA